VGHPAGSPCPPLTHCRGEHCVGGGRRRFEYAEADLLAGEGFVTSTATREDKPKAVLTVVDVCQARGHDADTTWRETVLTSPASSLMMVTGTVSLGLFFEPGGRPRFLGGAVSTDWASSLPSLACVSAASTAFGSRRKQAGISRPSSLFGAVARATSSCLRSSAFAAFSSSTSDSRPMIFSSAWRNRSARFWSCSRAGLKLFDVSLRCLYLALDLWGDGFRFRLGFFTTW